MTTPIQANKNTQAVLPRPLVSIRVIERLLLRHATGPTPEKRLIVAVICQAMVDSRCGSRDDRRTAQDFLRSGVLDGWANLVDLHPAFVREVARKTHYLPDAQEDPTDTTFKNKVIGRKYA